LNVVALLMSLIVPKRLRIIINIRKKAHYIRFCLVQGFATKRKLLVRLLRPFQIQARFSSTEFRSTRLNIKICVFCQMW